MNLSSVACALLAVGAVGGIVVKVAPQDVGPEGARAAVVAFVASIGESPIADSIKVHDGRKDDFYTIGGRLEGGLTFGCFVTRKDSTVIMFDNSGRQSQVARRQGLTDRKAFADERAAESTATAFVTQLKVPYEVLLLDSEFVQNEWGTLKKPGFAAYRFATYVHGYRFLDRECGIHVRFDAETGGIVNYHRYLERMFAVVPCDLPPTKLTAEEAWRRFNPSFPQPPSVKLGWAKPKESSHARLCYFYEKPMDETTAASSVYVDAETGQKVDPW